MKFERFVSRLAIGTAVFVTGFAAGLTPATAQDDDLETVAAMFGAR